ncbi:MAG TPA: hypothetical protein VIM41_15935, partial [Gammaproteobacteria bacterium]
ARLSSRSSKRMAALQLLGMERPFRVLAPCPALRKSHTPPRPTADSRLKVLVWQDEAGQVWLGYNDPAFIAGRHAVPECKAATGMGKALSGFAEKTIAKP